ncbi:hypothetical protein [Nonomuraea sp. NPDC049695]|uniref:tetratricopeptide repeat protein n=1 Tax=Nonomuraea sp. NPDC049695 TaxID=3154734 RepID=UPI003437FB78
MSDMTDIESVRRAAGVSLRYFWEATEHGTLDDLEDEDRLRNAYAAIQAAVPDDSTSAVCLTVLALGKLRAHLNDVSAGGEDHFEAHDDPPAGLDEDDEFGRELAREVVEAARHALRLQPDDNLAAFSLACALHWLGEDQSAAAAYREALRIDPHDDIARARVEELEDVELPDPPTSITTRHPYGFHLLEMTRVVGHSGSTKGRVWLLNDVSTVRSAAEDYLAGWLDGRGQGLDEDFGVWTHVPGGQSGGTELAEVIRQAPAGGPEIDWSRVFLPSLMPERRLRTGHPLRWLGQLHFFGCTEHDD